MGGGERGSRETKNLRRKEGYAILQNISDGIESILEQRVLRVIYVGWPLAESIGGGHRTPGNS